MPRTAKLGQKNGHWYSQAGGKARYYGKVGVVSHADAMKAFRKTLADIRAETRPKAAIRVDDLISRFLNWLDRHRSQRTREERSRHLTRFAAACGRRKACDVAAADVESFLDTLSVHASDYVKKHATSIRALFRWGVKHEGLPEGFNPFATLEPIHLPHKALLESDLPTRAEFDALIDHAESFRGLADILRVYYATGARTHELAAAKVGDYQPTTRQLLLVSHKRSKTLKDPTPRRIALNADAEAIVSRLCTDRPRDAHIFTRPSGLPWTRHMLAHRLRIVRGRAGVRPHITIYSFRHLWISEMLMAGVDVLLVARMAGTSVAMVERVYGHFRSQSYQDAQAKLDESRRIPA